MHSPEIYIERHEIVVRVPLHSLPGEVGIAAQRGEIPSQHLIEKTIKEYEDILAKHMSNYLIEEIADLIYL